MFQRPVLISVFIYLLFSLVCTQIPLLNYLGYEFSAITALVTSCVSSFLTIANVRTVRLDEGVPAKATKQAFRRSIILNLSLLAIPFGVMLLNAFFVRNCSLSEGMLFFLLLPVVSSWFSCCVGFFCAVHYRWPKTVFTLIFFATIAYALALGYFTPAIYSYNFFYGFFPGITYDEVLGIRWNLVFFRAMTLLLGIVFLGMGFLLVYNSAPSDTTVSKGMALLRSLFQHGRKWLTIGTAMALIVLYAVRCELGLESTSGFIQRELGGKIETEHFSIYYSSSSYAEEEARFIAAEHEFRLHQLLQSMSLTSFGKLESYVYPSSASKQQLMGAGATNIAKPWSGQIHITKQSLDGTLKHELAHVVVGQFGMPVIHANISTGLVEGLAMALEWDWGNRTLHQYSTAMKEFGVLPDIRRLMTPAGFAVQSSSVSYVVAGSFCRFLIDRYGIRMMMHLYRNGDYDAVYGRTLDELMKEWSGFLDRVPVPAQDRDIVDVLFRRPSIFKKVCARVIAGRNINAANAFARSDYADAAGLYKQSYDEGGSYEALAGYMTSLVRAGNFAEASAVLDTVILTNRNSAQYLPLYVNASLALWAEERVSKAEELLQRVERADIRENLTESAAILRAAMKDAVNSDKLLRYFVMSSADTLRLAQLDSMVQDTAAHWLPLYLKGHVLVRLQRWEEALTVLHRLDGCITAAPLNAIRLKTMGTVLFRLKLFEEAKVSFWTSLNYASSDAIQNEVNEWVDRCEWMKSYQVQ